MTDSPTIVWFRQDLRLDDHQALTMAARNGSVIPLYIWAPEEEGKWAPGPAGAWWLAQSLTSLDGELRQRRSRLIVRGGPSQATLCELAAATGAKKVVWNRRYEPASQRRDIAVERALENNHIAWESFESSLLFEPEKILNQGGQPYRVFTFFWNRCLQLPPPRPPIAAPKSLMPPPVWPESQPIAELAKLSSASSEGSLARYWRPGAAQARKQLKYFLNGALTNFPSGRDRPDHPGTSRLSPYLHFGEISPRRVWAELRDPAQRGSKNSCTTRAADAFLRQLVWREFAYYILHHFPQTPEQPSQSAFLKFPWHKDERGLQKWREGRTGYPLVDAGMRQLHETGWMHNRVRMVVASFLNKHLMISWRQGARWFWERLVDADLANNTFGWQWAAGCGHDAAPYFRIFNPVLQGEKFDPDGDYVRRWVPELAQLPSRWIHQPWEAPENVLTAAGVKLGKDYPPPIVDHAQARARALSAYQFIREQQKKK